MHPANQHASLARALQANDDGEFETCLELCDAVDARDDAAKIEIALLRARTHVRLGRGDRALDALRDIAFTPLPLEAYLSAQLLTGAAYVRLGQKERGEAILSAAIGKAEPGSALHSELALHLGIAKFRLGSYDEADQLFASVPVGADVVHANALEYRGWAAQARGDFEAAARYFRDALGALAACRRRDRFVEAKSLYGMSALCPELLLTQEWSMIERRVQHFDWSASGVKHWWFWVSIAASLMCETTGDTSGARRWARHAERSADNGGCRIVALCRLAAVFRGLRENNAHADLVELAREAYAALDLCDLGADLQQLPLYLAEEVVYTHAPGDAEALLAQYREIVLPTVKSSSGDLDRYVAMERSIEAVLLEACGETDEAVHALTWSYDVLSKLGYRRRATSIALRLARLTGAKRYVAYAESTLRGASPSFWMARELAEIRIGPGPTVTPTELEILELLVHGKTYKEIAAARCASVKTVGNHVQTLFRKFGVHSRGELAAEAIRRHIVILHHPQRTASD
jgi:DNA-binding CsgD family transcriptional regulator